MSGGEILSRRTCRVRNEESWNEGNALVYFGGQYGAKETKLEATVVFHLLKALIGANRSRRARSIGQTLIELHRAHKTRAWPAWKWRESRPRDS